MAQPIRTTLRVIMQRIKDLITGVLIPPNSYPLIPPGSLLPIPPERVIITMRRKIPTMHMQADNDIVLRPRGFRVESKITNYAGRVDTRIVRKLEVIYRSRLDLDDPSRDEIHLLDADLGHGALEDAVINCLQEAKLVESSTSDNWLLSCPMLLIDGTDPEPESETGSSGGWVKSSLMFEMQYMQSFTEYPS